MKRIYCSIALILTLLVLSTACTAEGINAIHQDRKGSIIDRTIYELASDEYKGRLTGTKENEDTGRYIIKLFEEIGLEKYKGSYSNRYDHKFYDPKDQTRELIVEYGGENKQFIAGKDFLLTYEFDNLSVTGKATFDAEKEDMFVVLENSSDMAKVSNKRVKGILIKNDNFKKTLIVREKGIPVIQINNEVYELLKKNPEAIVTANSISKARTIKAENIVGLLKGKDNKTALVISAHFDHVGSIGANQVQGAIDNISGLSVMLGLAQKLKESSETGQLECDVLFCAFNGEESGLQGSKAFVSDIVKEYETINNINLDCLGIVNGGKLVISAFNDSYSIWAEDLSKFLAGKKLPVTIDLQGSVTSDHISFGQKDIPALLLIQENIGFTHTLKDTTKSLDISYLKAFCENLHEYISSYYSAKSYLQESEKNGEDSEHDHSLHAAEDEEIYNILEAEESKLRFNQFKYIKIKDNIYTVFNRIGKFDSIDEYMSLFKDSTLPAELNGYKFKQIYISAEMDISNVPPESAELDKAYDGLPVSKNDITSLIAHYINYSIDELLTISLNIFKDEKEMKFFSDDIIAKKGEGQLVEKTSCC